MALLTGTVISASANGQNYQSVIGGTYGNIRVDGIIGDFDNTTAGPSPEEINEWINVTLPVQTLFWTYNDEGHITSPSYSIINNSFRGVSVNAGIADLQENTDVLNVLNVNNIPLVANGQAAVGGNRELARLTGNLGSAPTTEFSFNGQAAITSGEEINPHLIMPLTFSVIDHSLFDQEMIHIYTTANRTNVNPDGRLDLNPTGSLVIWNATGVAHQLWHVELDATTGTYAIVNAINNQAGERRFLTAGLGNGNVVDGVLEQGNYSRWRFIQTETPGIYNVLNVGTGEYMSVSNGNNSQTVFTISSNQAAGSRWRINRVNQ